MITARLKSTYDPSHTHRRGFGMTSFWVFCDAVLKGRSSTCELHVRAAESVERPFMAALVRPAVANAALKALRYPACRCEDLPLARKGRARLPAVPFDLDAI